MVLDPLAGQVHRVAHVDLLLFESVHFFHEGLLTGEVFDALVGSLFFFLQLHDAGLKKLLLVNHLFLLVNSFHHVGLGLGSYHGQA